MSSPAACDATAGARQRYRPYPGYRDTGVDWLGSVPRHWEAKRLKYAVDLINEKTEDTNGRPYVGLEHIESWTGHRIEPETPVSLDGTACLFAPGDVLFGKLRPYLAKVHLAEEPGACTAEALVLRSRLVCPAYLRYYILTRQFIEVVDGSTYGSKMPRANWQFISALPCLLPPLPEQRAIAAFLDQQTRRIDELIAKKRRLIELLAEKRAALISHAVIKGLDPTTPMKPSGVNWLGDVPTQWEIRRLKTLFINLNHRRIPLSSEVRGGMSKIYPYYGASGIIDYVDDYIFDEPLILVAEDGANLLSRSTPLAFVASGQYWVNNHAHILRPRSGPLSFWESLLQLAPLEPLVSGSAQPKLTKENLGSLPLPVPPLDEQQVIARTVDRIREQYDGLIGAVNQGTGTLTELRSALISAAVTGKVDVREAC